MSSGWSGGFASSPFPPWDLRAPAGNKSSAPHNRVLFQIFMILTLPSHTQKRGAIPHWAGIATGKKRIGGTASLACGALLPPQAVYILLFRFGHTLFNLLHTVRVYSALPAAATRRRGIRSGIPLPIGAAILDNSRDCSDSGQLGRWGSSG